jgi:hypothetical protein
MVKRTRDSLFGSNKDKQGGKEEDRLFLGHDTIVKVPYLLPLEEYSLELY